MRLLSAILVGVLAAIVGACEATPCDETSGQECAAEPSDSEPGDGWTEARSFSLDRGILSEAGITMKAGDWLDVEYTVEDATGGAEQAEVAWNVHTHVTDDSLNHSKLAGSGSQGRGAGDSYRFVAPADGVYWSLWTNDGAAAIDVEVSYHGEGSTSFRGWH